MTQEQESRIRAVRHQARTNLFFLATQILGYDKIRPHVHQPMMDRLVQFGGVQGEDYLDSTGFRYIPRDPDPVNVLPPGNNRRLILDPRGWFKTTINCISHSIQIILNFPDVTVQAIHANLDIVQREVLRRVKDHFTNNPKMRYYFPEFCAPINPKSGKPKELGNASEIMIPCTNRAGTPTFSVSSIGSTSAGGHYHWLKFTDIVTEQNCFGEQLQKIYDLFGISENLLISTKYFIDVEGTCYHYADTYNRIIKDHLRTPEEKRTWIIFCRGCFEKVPPEGDFETFEPEERNLPYRLDEEGKRISRFEEHDPAEALERTKLRNEWIFAGQKLNNPFAADEGNRPFPLNKMRWIEPEALKHVGITHYTMTVDTAEKPSKRADFTAITVLGWDRNHNAYLVDAAQGKWLPQDTVNNIFAMYHRWHCIYLGIEEMSFNRGLEPAIRSVMDRDPTKWMNLHWIKRDTNEPKVERILLLQPFFNTGMLRFSSALRDYEKEQLQEQFSEFPAGQSDDLLDSLADHFQDKKDFAPTAPSPTTQEVMKRAFDKMLEGEMAWTTIYGPDDPDYDSKLGAL